MKKILIRSANWVGDAVMSLPAITALRHNFPAAEIAVLAKPWVSEIFQDGPEADRVILYHSPGVHEGTWGKWRLARELRAEGFDWVLHLPNSFESALISFLAGIPQRVGYNTDGRGLLLTRRVQVTKETKRGHQVEYYNQLLRSLGYQVSPTVPQLKSSGKRREEGRKLIHSLGLKENAAWVGISPGAAYGSAKEWFPERYAEVAGRIQREWGAKVLVFGSEADKAVASRICRTLGEKAFDLTGKTTLAQAMGILSFCRLFITNDSGLMHVASALGIPLIAIFGSTDPGRTGPRSEKSRVLRKLIYCAPCLKKTCPKDRECMQIITAEEVFQEAQRMWKSLP